jgi:glycosyltransferase involved in cell wall biosynthesis
MRSPIERIAIISDDSVESGGAAGIALESARMLSQRGFPVTFLTGDSGNNPSLKTTNVQLETFNGTDLLNAPRSRAMLRGLYDNRARQFLQSWITANDTPRTIYHLHNWHKFLSPSVFTALAPVGHRLFLTAHDYFLACPNGGYSNFPRGTACDLKPLSRDCLFSNCDKRNYGHKLWRVARQLVREHLCDLNNIGASIIAVSDAMVPLLERGGIARELIRVLRNPVTPWRTTAVRAENNKQVFFVGRLELDKGVDVLARAAELAGAPLTIVGDGPLRLMLASRYPGVRLTGRLNKQEIGELIEQARFLVMPTRWRETFGLVAVESLMCGVPVVASTLAPISEEIAKHGFGLTCEPDNVDALAAQIMELTSNDALIAEMSRRAYAEAHILAPAPDQWCDRLVKLYEDKLLHMGVSPAIPSTHATAASL